MTARPTPPVPELTPNVTAAITSDQARDVLGRLRVRADQLVARRDQLLLDPPLVSDARWQSYLDELTRVLGELSSISVAEVTLREHVL